MSTAFRQREVAPHELRGAVRQAMERPDPHLPGIRRFGHQTARVLGSGGVVLEVLVLDISTGGGEILMTHLPEDAASYPSLTPLVPAAHWAERAIGDLFHLRADGHPRWKSLILHEAWPASFAPLRERSHPAPRAEPGRAPYRFLEVGGEGVHEIPVGPIHAGIIEPGHFRFSCLGEVINNLEIRLGYQHRGVERRLAEIPWSQARYVAEAASSDTAIGNALAHSVAMEQIFDVDVPPRAEALRSMALEVERMANHLGDLGGLSADIGYSAGAALFGRLRGSALGLGELLTGNRVQRGYVMPGGVARDLDDTRQVAFRKMLTSLATEIEGDISLLLEHPAVIDRMEGVGRLAPSLAREFGLVGPAARASGSDYDARNSFHHGLYPEQAPVPARRETGDVLARTQVRAEEIAISLRLLTTWTDTLPASGVRAPIGASLPRSRVGVGVIEAWRGELIHWVTTDDEGRIQRYAIKDPSFNNWTGLAIAIRGNLVADFPLCNKSFNLSYSGNDL